MHINKIHKIALGLAFVVLAASCSLSTSMDATIEREVEAATKLKEKAKAPTEIAPEDTIRVKKRYLAGRHQRNRIRGRAYSQLPRRERRHYAGQQPADYAL